MVIICIYVYVLIDDRLTFRTNIVTKIKQWLDKTNILLYIVVILKYLKTNCICELYIKYILNVFFRVYNTSRFHFYFYFFKSIR